MINYELLEAINANKIMKKEEKINKALLLIEQLTNKKPVLKEKTEPVTKHIVDIATKIVSKDVLAPKVVRNGLLKETVEKPIKRRFYAVTDDFEKQAKRLIAFYNDMLVLHPELKSEANKIKRALGAIEQTFTNTEMFINENKKEEQLELDFENGKSLQEEIESSDFSFENWKKALHLYDTSSLESDINRHQSNGIKPTEEQDKALTQLFRGSKVTSRFIMRSDFGRWKTAATVANYNKDCKDFGKQKVDDLVNKVLNIYTPLLQEDVTPIKDERDFVKLWWADLHPFERVELGRKYFPDKHYSDITKESIQVIFDKEVTNKKEETLTEDIAGMTTASMAAFDGGLGIKLNKKK